MRHLDHYDHLDSKERGAYTLRLVVAAIGDDKNAHNLTCDQIEQRTRGCTICVGELLASQAMFTAKLLNAVELLDEDAAAPLENVLAGLLDAGWE